MCPQSARIGAFITTSIAFICCFTFWMCPQSTKCGAFIITRVTFFSVFWMFLQIACHLQELRHPSCPPSPINSSDTPSTLSSWFLSNCPSNFSATHLYTSYEYCKKTSRQPNEGIMMETIEKIQHVEGGHYSKKGRSWSFLTKTATMTSQSVKVLGNQPLHFWVWSAVRTWDCWDPGSEASGLSPSVQVDEMQLLVLVYPEL